MSGVFHGISGSGIRVWRIRHRKYSSLGLQLYFYPPDRAHVDCCTHNYGLRSLEGSGFIRSQGLGIRVDWVAVKECKLINSNPLEGSGVQD